MAEREPQQQMTQSSQSDTLDRLRNIDPYEFEEFVGELWERQGWKTEVSQSSNDKGVDVVAEKTDGMVDQKLAIQAKRYSEGNKIGRQDVQQYHSMKVQDATADAAVVATTSSFSTPAEDWASEHNVKLIDGQDLVEIVEERGAYELVDEYAPTLRESSLDPVADSDGAVASSGSAAEVDLPDVLADEDNRKKIGIAGILAGLVLIANPTGVAVPIEVLGTLLALGAVAVWQAPEAVWGLVTPDRTVHREFSNGGAVVEATDSIQYEPPGDRDAIEFEKGDDHDRRQRAAVYGALDERASGALTETEAGVLPTDIASKGPETIAAYRYAVHREKPSTIASDLDITQQAVVDHLVGVASE